MAKFKSWTQNERKILETYYVEEGGKLIQKRLPGKSLSQIYGYACYLGLKYNQKNRVVSPNAIKALRTGVPYSEQEKSAIAAFYPAEGSAMHKRIPPRTRASVANKAQRMRVRYKARKPWSEEEKERLIALIQAYGAQAACKELGRSYSSVASYCCRHDISLEPEEAKSGRWTENEIIVLRVLYPTKGPAFCAEALGRPKKSIIRKWDRIKKAASINGDDALLFESTAVSFGRPLAFCPNFTSFWIPYSYYQKE